MLTVLHFDINGTIIGTDATDNASLKEAVAEIICRNMYHWKYLCHMHLWNYEESYYDYIKREHPDDYKKICYNVIDEFRDENPYSYFVYLPEDIESFQDISNRLEQIFKLGLFESFRNIIDMVSQSNDLRLVFRTFGLDGQDVMKQLPFNFVCLKTKWEDNTCFFMNQNEKVDLVDIVQNEHVFIQDDYSTWNKNKKDVKFGKFIPSSEGLEQIGFDDNLCMYSDDKNVKIVKVNTVSAALDPEYYTKFF